MDALLLIKELVDNMVRNRGYLLTPKYQEWMDRFKLCSKHLPPEQSEILFDICMALVSNL